MTTVDNFLSPGTSCRVSLRGARLLGRQGPGQRAHHYPREGHVHRYSVQGNWFMLDACCQPSMSSEH